MTDERDAADTGGMRIETDLVRQLAELLSENDLTEIEVQDGDRRIAVKRQPAAAAPPPSPPLAQAAAAAAPTVTAPAAEVAPASSAGAIKSPMVGTVYLSGEPGAPPFASPGRRVGEGDTLVIIEAMKVMNPIVAPRSGTIAAILVQDGQPVEFDQPLLILE